MSYGDLVLQDRRLCLLRSLHDDPDYAANDSVLQGLLSQMGHGVSRDVVRSDLAWLAEQGLVVLETPIDGVTVARLLERGADVATGRSVVPGVRRPSPRAVMSAAARSAKGILEG